MGCLSETQYAVFLSDVSTGGELDLDGGGVAPNAGAACYVFDSFAEAEAFCGELVGRHERMVCEIYDSRGKAVPPLRVVTHPKAAGRPGGRMGGRRSALWKIRIAWLLLAVAPPLFWLDYRSRGLLVVPTVVGFACIVTCVRLLWWGYGELEELKRGRGERDWGGAKKG
jgi:hypothetical protein